jgi:thymidylate synthase
MDEFGSTYNRKGSVHHKEIDQLKLLIEGIKKLHGRRHILTAWNP